MSRQIQGPDWVLEQESAAWRARDSNSELVFDGQMWIFGGWIHQKEKNLRDVWSSYDGQEWVCRCEEAPWEKSDLPLSLVFDGRMWHMGGRSVPGTECSREVYSTRDGATWDLATAEAEWSARLGMAGVVFDGRMWLFGGTASFYLSDETTLSNEVWSSADGVTWRLENAGAAWCPRAYHKVVEFGGKLWLTGGGGVFSGGFCLNDVWCSENGVDWECVVEEAPWATRVWHGFEVYRGHMWVISGDCTCGGGFLNDVWCSADGREWTQVVSEVVFGPRHEISTFVFEDKLWVAAGLQPTGFGHINVLANDVWSLSLPGDFAV